MTGHPDVSGRAVTRAYPRSRRIRRRHEFDGVFSRGIRLHSRYFTVLLQPSAGPNARLGIVASKKLGGAVQRNRAKRLIREMFRQHVAVDRGPGVDLVVIPRPLLFDAQFSSLTQDFFGIWRRVVDRVAAHARR